MAVIVPTMDMERGWGHARATTIRALICAFSGLGLLVGAASGAAASTQSDEAYIHAKVNEARQGQMAPLRSDSRLVEVARDQAERMRDQGRIFHNPNNGADVEAQGVDWERVGENVGVGPNAADVQRAFMNSSPHRANILDPRFTELGVGVAVASNGRVYVAQVFAKIREQAPVAQPAAEPKTAQPAPVDSAPAEPAPIVEAPPAVVEAPPVTPEPAVPAGYILLEDGSIVASDFVVERDQCGASYAVAEDGTIIPLIFDVADASC